MSGFPAGQKKGFEDTRGTLFFDIARIIAAKIQNFFLDVKALQAVTRVEHC